MKSLFHLAFNVGDLDLARRFYGGVLGCTEGRSTATWVDFDFFGHQLSLHLGEPFKTERTGHVGDKLVPMPHFGLVLGLPDWQAMAQRCSRPTPSLCWSRRRALKASPASSGPCFFAIRLAAPSKSRASGHSMRCTQADDAD
jgi:extradiol dioxygenase family protein